MARVTEEQLESVVARINVALGAPVEPYAERLDENRELVTNTGHCMVARTGGGFKLVQLAEGGGEIDLSVRDTKSNTYVWCLAFLAGVCTARN